MPGLFATFGGGMQAARPAVRNASNTGWQECEKYLRNDANSAWIRVWPSMSASAPNVSRNDFINEPAPASRTVSAGTSVTVAGSIGAVTYAWARVSGSTAISISNASAANPTFTASVRKNEGGLSAGWRCTVTDSAGQTTAFTISVFLDYNTNL